jgi:hypothetical protein
MGYCYRLLPDRDAGGEGFVTGRVGYQNLLNGALLCAGKTTPLTGAMIMSSVSAWWAEPESPGRVVPEPTPRRAARSKVNAVQLRNA